MTSRNVFFSVAMTFAIVLSFAACGLQTGGLPGGTGGEGGTQLACANDAQCDDGNPCTTESCDVPSGVCLTPKPQADGPLPVALQTAGDCVTLSCKAGEPVSDPDDHDFLVDDNDCTVDQCASGKPLHVVEPDGTACLINAANGSCKTGECVVECGDGKPCDDKEPCTTDACDAQLGKCTFIALVEGTVTPGSADGVGNCKVDICVGGKAAVVTDDSDTPPPENDCQKGSCAAGVPSPTYFAKNVPCSSAGGKICDGAGTCVECNDNIQCGANDDCNTFTCDAHACHDTFTVANTPTVAQNPGDCQQVVCDGTGKTTSIADNADFPEDSNDCTVDSCTAGVPSNIKKPVGTVCGNNSSCNLIGQCGCTDNTQCLSPQTCGGGNPGTPNVCGCTKATCATLGKSCGTFPDGCGGTINCDDATKNGGETDVDCGGAACSQKCAQGKLCVANSDCSGGFCADGRCCDGACNGACQACNLAGSLGSCSPIVSNVDNNPANACSGNNSCDMNGACKKINGQVCVAGGECVSGNCIDGRCCDGTCNGTCQACNLVGKLGQCSNIGAGVTDPNATVPCINNNSCDGAGACKKNNGQVCAAAGECLSPNCVDGVCCNSGCGTTCQSCNVAGSEGTCTNIPSGQTDTSPANACNGSKACNGGNGAAACKTILAQACAVNGDCLSSFCADGVCCNGACNAACRACNIAGSVGTCINLTSGTDSSPAGICIAPNSCDAAGNCKKVNGTACGASSECISGTCLDNFCCGSASCPTCQACTGANGTCVNLALNAPDTVPANACSGNNTCDGMGACKAKLAQGCLNGTTCASGFCADGVCCDAACSGTCQACTALKKGSGPDGICNPIANNTDPDLECVGTKCNGLGACIPKAANGTVCANGNQCNSGNCVDSYCCDTACDTACLSCNQGGKLGICSPIVLAQDNNPANICNGNNACNAVGACKTINGLACNVNADCVTGFCTDGVCCASSCNGQCKACNVPMNLGSCVDIPSGQTDDNATAVCNGTNVCNGGGLCKLANGQVCTGTPSDCVNGTCADGVCCQNACTGPCMSCNLPTKEGQCLNLGLDATDDAPVCGGAMDATHLCDGSGACLLITGQACANSTQCAHHNCVSNVCQP
jgi:hypothetical protein